MYNISIDAQKTRTGIELSVLRGEWGLRLSLIYHDGGARASSARLGSADEPTSEES